MVRYSSKTKENVRKMRALGKTYSEIKKELKISFPKSTLYELCRGVVLPSSYIDKVGKINYENLSKAQKGAWAINRIKRKKFLDSLVRINKPLARMIDNRNDAKIALAMLCLGEASKYNTGGPFGLGSSNPKIILLFLAWLKQCFDFKEEKIRCTVQCRADQNIPELEQYWQRLTGIPKRLFYEARVDPRTIGKPTKKTSYKGVLRVNYLDSSIQLELESLADLIYNRVVEGR